MSIIQLFLTFFLFIFGAAAYFMPSFIAFGRDHRNKIPLLIINLFLGWTVIFWVIALAWSFWSFDETQVAKKTKLSSDSVSVDEKKKEHVGIIVICIGIFLIAALLAVWVSLSPIAVDGLQAQEGIAGAPAVSSGVPMSADDFLKSSQ